MKTPGLTAIHVPYSVSADAAAFASCGRGFYRKSGWLRQRAPRAIRSPGYADVQRLVRNATGFPPSRPIGRSGGGGGDNREQAFAVTVSLRGTDSMNQQEILDGARAYRCDLAESLVARDDVRRNALVACNLEPMPPKRLEKNPSGLVQRVVLDSLPGLPGGKRTIGGTERRRQKDASGAISPHDGATLWSQDDDRSIAAVEIDPSGGNATAQQSREPVVAAIRQNAEGRGLVQPGCLESGILHLSLIHI